MPFSEMTFGELTPVNRQDTDIKRLDEAEDVTYTGLYKKTGGTPTRNPKPLIKPDLPTVPQFRY